MDGRVKAARIMLNMLGLVLEDGEKKELEIYDKENNIVGKLTDNEDIDIQANINGEILTGKLKMFGNHVLVNNRFSRQPVLFREPRDYYFQFKVVNKDLSETSGQIHLVPYPNPVNLRCGCKVLLQYSDHNGKKIQFTSDGSVPLLVNIEDKDSFEKLHMSFNSYRKNGIAHRVESGGYDKNIHNYRSCNAFELTDKPKYIEVKSMNRGFDEDSIKKSSHIYLKEIHEIKEYKNRESEYEAASDEEMIQHGKLAHKYDPTISKCLEYLCTQVFMIGDTSIFKNLLNMCFDDYSDEVFDALFRIERDRSFYQNKAVSLVDAYFDLSKWENYSMNKRR